MGGLIRMSRVAFFAAALALPGFAKAQEWPTKPVTVVVPFVAGGTTDIVGRIVAQAMSEKLGQRFVIENVGGAGGNLGAMNAAKAAPDGYTIFMSTVAHAMAPGIYSTLSYNFEKDFDPVTIVGTVPNILVVNPSVPAKSVQELIAYIKANPGKLNYGSAGVGSTEHMSSALFASMTGGDIVHVPYRGGAPMMADLVAGHIQMSIETSGAATPFIKSGQVRIQIGNRTVTELAPDTIFGEMALIDDEPRSATAVAATDVELVPVSEKQFLFLVSQTPYFALKVMRVLATRLRETNKSLG